MAQTSGGSVGTAQGLAPPNSHTALPSGWFIRLDVLKLPEGRSGVLQPLLPHVAVMKSVQ